MQDLENWSRKYLATWDRRAVLRSERRSPVTRDGLTDDLVPAEYCRVLKSASVQRLGAGARRFISTQAAYCFMEEIAVAETDLICVLATEIANRPRSVPIPTAARQVLLTVGTDEIYHAYRAREFMQEVASLSGIHILPDLLPDDFCIHSALRRVRSDVSPALWPDFQVLALCFSEMSLADEVLAFTQKAGEDNAFNLLMKEHFRDEGRHKAFFLELLRYFWGGLDDEVRGVFAGAIPRLFDFAFGSPDAYAARQRAILGAAGLDEDEAKRAWAEVWGAGTYDKRRHPIWENLQNGLDRCGLLADTRVFDALEDAGWCKDGVFVPADATETAMAAAD